MPDEENPETNGHENCSEPYVNQTCKDDSSSLNGGQKGGADGQLQMRHVLGSAPPTISIMISRPEESSGSNAVMLKNVASDRDEKIGKAAIGSANKGFLPRSESYQEQCRICQQQTDEPLIDLGCRCRGELANAHQSCIGIWFCTRGSNKCEICLLIIGYGELIQLMEGILNVKGYGF